MASLENDQLQTWIDLLNRAPESVDTVAGPSSGSTGVRVSMSTPVGARTASRLERGGSDAMRSQVVSLLKQKQELLQRVHSEQEMRKKAEYELDEMKRREKDEGKTRNGDRDFSLQISTLRAALDQTTQEKRALREELTRERTNCSEVKGQLVESESRCGVLEQHLRDRERECSHLTQKSEEADKLSAQVEHLKGQIARLLRQQNAPEDSKKREERLIHHNADLAGLVAAARGRQHSIEGEVGSLRSKMIEHQSKLSASEDKVAQLKSERAALMERVSLLEAEGAEAADDTRQELESGVIELTNQLEQLLQLNQQLQEEVMELRGDKERLSSSFSQSSSATNQLSHEKVTLQHRLLSTEQQLKALSSELTNKREEESEARDKLHTCQQELEALREELMNQTTSSLATIEGLQSQLADANKSANQITAKFDTAQHELRLVQEVSIRERETRLREAERSHLELKHKLEKTSQEKKVLLSKLEAMKAECGRLWTTCSKKEEERSSLHRQLTHLQKERASHEAKMVTVTAELTSSSDKNAQLKRQLSELQFSQTHSRGQVENLSAQLVEQARQLEVCEGEKKQFQTRVKKLESKLHEMALQHELTSSKLQDSMRKMAGDYSSTLANLQKVQTEKHTLERQLSSRQVEMDGMREKVRVLEDERVVARRRDKELVELENSMSTMREELDSLVMTNTGIRNSTLLSQTHQGLRDKLSILQQQLDNSLALSEGNGPASSHSLSQLGDTLSPPTLPIRKTRSLSPVPCNLAASPTHDSSSASQESPRVSESPSTDALHLKQKLAEARQTCLKLNQQHSRTELSRMQGSLQALIKIQEHLTHENQSLSKTFSTMEAEKEALQQESNALRMKLSRLEEKLTKLTTEMTTLEEKIWNELDGALGRPHAGADTFTQLQETALSMAASWRRLKGEVETLTEQLSSVEEERETRREELKAFQEKHSALHEEVAMAQDEVKEREKVIREREDTVTRLEQLLEEERHKVDKERERITQDTDRAKRTLDTQYQAKISVLKSNLVSREEDMALLESKHKLLLAELDQKGQQLATMTEKLAGMTKELKMCEEVMRLESQEIGAESKRQATDLARLREELAEVKESYSLSEGVVDMEEVKDCEESVLQLQAEIEMLRGKKEIMEQYIQTNKEEEEDEWMKENEQIVLDNEGLMVENSELRQEIATLRESAAEVQDEVERLALQLGEEEKERENRVHQLENQFKQQLENEVLKTRLGLEECQLSLQRQCAVLEAELDTLRLREEGREKQREQLMVEMADLRVKLQSTQQQHQEEMEHLQYETKDRESALTRLQSALDEAIAERETLEAHLNESTRSSDSSLNSSVTKKVDKMKAKLKQQVTQANHLRTKLGYALSEVRLHRQLKGELENQVVMLQEALTESQQQNKVCLTQLQMATNIGREKLLP